MKTCDECKAGVEAGKSWCPSCFGPTGYTGSTNENLSGEEIMLTHASAALEHMEQAHQEVQPNGTSIEAAKVLRRLKEIMTAIKDNPKRTHPKRPQ